jgi:hypothetical protein
MVETKQRRINLNSNVNENKESKQMNENKESKQMNENKKLTVKELFVSYWINENCEPWFMDASDDLEKTKKEMAELAKFHIENEGHVNIKVFIQCMCQRSDGDSWASWSEKLIYKGPDAEPEWERRSAKSYY